MNSFTLDASPDASRLTVDGVDVTEHAARVIVDVNGRAVPQVTVFTRLPGTITGDGVVTVVREPSPQEIDAAALDAIGRIDVDAFTAQCEAKVRAGRHDPYRVAIEVMQEMAGG